MEDTDPQTAGGKVLWHFTMSLDEFVAAATQFDSICSTATTPPPPLTCCTAPVG